jgi:predicted 2-oxoglutarate/Fe(II)-dependent dioxygenase YbiX/peroxiredoxin
MADAADRPRSRPLAPGAFAPWFKAQALGGSPRYVFDTVAGRHVLMLFFGSAGSAAGAAALAEAGRRRALFDDRRACFFGVTIDPADEAEGRVKQALPGIRFFLDFDRAISRLYGADADPGYRPHWLVLDPMLRVRGAYPLDRGAEAIALLEALSRDRREAATAPVLAIDDVLSPALCRALIDGYEAQGGEPSGFMREVDGKTVCIVDPAHKQRRDWDIADPALRQALQASVATSIAPAIARAFQFHATRIERYIVACYAAGAGHFRPHRDNTTAGTAHRRFAVTINLNDDYEGGDLRFPEFGDRTYRAPPGGAIVFSCSLLHEATPVTSGRRFATLPFLYDDEAARLREANNSRLGEGVAPYRS